LAQTQVWPALRNFGKHQAVDGLIDIGIVKHDERRIAAKFQRQLLDIRCALFHQQTAGSGRTGESQFTDNAAAAQLATDGHRIAGDDIEHAIRNAGTPPQLSQRQRRVRRQFGRFQHHRATCGQCRRNLARHQRTRKIPGRDGGAYANRLTDCHQALVAAGIRQDIAIDALGFFCKELDETSGVSNLA